MIRLRAEVAGEDHQLSIQRREGMVLAEIDNRSYRLEVRKLNDGGYLLVDGSSVYNCHVATSGDEPDRIEVFLDGSIYAVRLIDPKRLRSGQTGTDHQKGSARIVAPMPGKVVRVLCEVGTRVEAGAGILVVEAMKMQNEMKSPKAGVVVSIDAASGTTVNAGDVLAVVE
ncbi:MAG: biotin/lipoyl-containing protein [Pyrinomonadaceae bacterium]